MDCMEGMKQFPDGYFELAIVDPPYGDGISGGNPDRFGERFDRYKLGGQQTYRPFAEINAPERERERETHGSPQTWQRRNMESAEQGEHGRRSSQKNHFVGCCSGAGLFRGTVPHLTEPDYLGGAITSTYRQLDVSLFGEK